MFKHIIITRFNLPKKWNTDKKGNDILDDKWLKKRYYLFENFCFTSIKYQNNQNFEWWVYFDENMPNYYKSKNNELSREFANFIPKYELSYEDFEINMPKDISKKMVLENKEWLITTRIDNDDMFAIDTIDLIQKKTVFSEKCILEIPYGYTLELRNKAIVRKVEAYLNPFISLVEKKTNYTDIESVYYRQHNQWKNIKTKIISTKRQWVQIIHENNISNVARGEEELYYNLQKRFVFNEGIIKFQNVITFFLRKIYFFVYKTIK